MNDTTNATDQRDAVIEAMARALWGQFWADASDMEHDVARQDATAAYDAAVPLIVAGVRELHWIEHEDEEYGGDICHEDGANWPCRTVAALDALDALPGVQRGEPDLWDFLKDPRTIDDLRDQVYSQLWEIARLREIAVDPEDHLAVVLIDNDGTASYRDSGEISPAAFAASLRELADRIVRTRGVTS